MPKITKMTENNDSGFKQNNFTKHDNNTCRASENLAHKVSEMGKEGDIGVFENALSFEQNGNLFNGSSTTEKQVSEILIETAKKHNLFYPNNRWNEFGERKRLQSGESLVFLNEKEDYVYKIKNPFAKKHLKNLNPANIIYEHIVHNLLFENSKYDFIGISEQDEEVRIILRQAFIYEYSLPSQKQIEKHLSSKGLIKEDAYYFGNEYLSVTDVDAKSDNVLINSKGELFFIDPIIKFKKPAKTIIEYLQNTTAEEDKQVKPNIFKRLFYSAKH